MDSQSGDEDGQWRFGLDDVGEDGAIEERPIEPESPDIENVVFVVLGVLGALLLLFAGV